MHLNISFEKWPPFCPGRDELIAEISQEISATILDNVIWLRNDISNHWYLLLQDISLTKVEIRLQISNNIYVKLWDTLTYPCRNS